MNNLLKLAC